VPTRRPDDDYDDRPRRRDEDDDRPRWRLRDDGPPPKSGGAGRVLLILVLVAGGAAVLCCGGCAGLIYLMIGRQVTMLDGTRNASARGGTSSVTVNVRVGGDSPGGFVRGDYYFVFRAGGRTSVHNVGLIGQGGAEFRSLFATPELAGEPGPVEFWVERRDRDRVFPVSPRYTIP
jgi:hypothetical protein